MFHSYRAFIFLAVGWLNVFHFLYWNFEFIYVAFQIYTAYYDLSKYMLLMSRYLCVCRILSSTKREFDSRQSSTLPWLHNHFGFNDCPVILMQTASLFHAYFIWFVYDYGLYSSQVTYWRLFLFFKKKEQKRNEKRLCLDIFFSISRHLEKCVLRGCSDLLLECLMLNACLVLFDLTFIPGKFVYF